MESCLICGPSSKLIDKKCNECNQEYDPQKIDLPDNISKFTKSVNNFFFTIKDAQSLNGFLDYTSQLRKNLNISYDVTKQVYNWFDNEIKKIQSFSNFTIKVQSEYIPHNIQKKIFQISFSIQNIAPKERFSFSINFSDEHEVTTTSFIKPNQQIDLSSDLNYSNFGHMNLNDLSLNIKNQFEEQQKFIIETFKIAILKPKPINLAENVDQDSQIQYLDLSLFPIINLEDLNKSISPPNFQSEMTAPDDEFIPSNNSNDSSTQPQPFYVNEYSSNKSTESAKKEKIVSVKNIDKSDHIPKKKSFKTIIIFLILIILGFLLLEFSLSRNCNNFTHIFAMPSKCYTWSDNTDLDIIEETKDITTTAFELPEIPKFADSVNSIEDIYYETFEYESYGNTNYWYFGPGYVTRIFLDGETNQYKSERIGFYVESGEIFTEVYKNQIGQETWRQNKFSVNGNMLISQAKLNYNTWEDKLTATKELLDTNFNPPIEYSLSKEIPDLVKFNHTNSDMKKCFQEKLGIKKQECFENYGKDYSEDFNSFYEITSKTPNSTVGSVKCVKSIFEKFCPFTGTSQNNSDKYFFFYAGVNDTQGKEYDNNDYPIIVGPNSELEFLINPKSLTNQDGTSWFYQNRRFITE